MREVSVLCTVFVFVWAAAVTASGPVYDQRQEGHTNVHAQLENVVVLLVPPQGMGLLDLVELASKSVGVGGGKHEAEPHQQPYAPPDLHSFQRHHTPGHDRVTTSHDRVTTSHDRVTPQQSLDDKLQRDPDYEQVKKHFSNLPSLPVDAFDDASAPVQEATTAPPNDVVPSSSTPKPSSSDDATPLFVKDAVTAHSPKLALYSQFRSAVQPTYQKKHNRASR